MIELYHSSNKENVDELAMEEVKNAVSVYMPFIDLEDYTSKIVNATEINSPYIEISIKYSYKNKKNEVLFKLQFSR